MRGLCYQAFKMRVFSVAYFNRGGSKRNSKETASSSNSFGTSAASAAAVASVIAAAPGNGTRRARDDRPFPPAASEVASGAYIISPPPSYNISPGGGAAQASHTLQFVRCAMQRNLGGGGRSGGWRGSNPDLKRMNNSGFTIYADSEECGGGGGSDWPPSGLSTGRPRRRHGSSGALFSGGEGENGIRSMKKPFQRSRSASGRRREGSCRSSGHTDGGGGGGGGGFVWPTPFYPAIAVAAAAASSTTAATTASEPIYSEPLPPMAMQVREAEKKSVQKQCYPNPSEPAQISQHIYEYLVTRRSDACTHVAADCGAMSSQVAPAARRPTPKAVPRQRHSLDSTSDSRSVSAVSGAATSAPRRRGSLSSSSSPSSSAASSTSKRDSRDSSSGRQGEGHQVEFVGQLKLNDQSLRVFFEYKLNKRAVVLRDGQ